MLVISSCVLTLVLLGRVVAMQSLLRALPLSLSATG